MLSWNEKKTKLFQIPLTIPSAIFKAWYVYPIEIGPRKFQIGLSSMENVIAYRSVTIMNIEDQSYRRA